MKDIIPAKKQSPILGLTGMGGGVGSNIVAGLAKESPYIEKLFNTYAYRGNATIRSINNGIDLSKNGGMVWIKNRSSTFSHTIFDTKRGATNIVRPNNDNAQTTGSTTLTSFNDNGFSLGTDSMTNSNTDKTVAWSFSKRKGFFDVVTYTGNGSNRTIAHSLGSVPGFYMIKRTDASSDWICFHREFITGNHYMVLNSSAAMVSESDVAQNTRPTSSVFSVGTDSKVNADGGTYVCYLFAGGESTADTARSVDLDASGDYLDVVASSDFSFGTGDFTVEGWFKVDSTSAAQTIIGVWDYQNNQRSWLIEANNSGGLLFSVSNNGSSTTDVVGSNCVSTGVWTHFAAVRDGDNLKLFVNGTQVATSSYSMTLYANSSDKCFIGLLNGATNKLTGKLSNFRVVKGTAVYTSSFRPPTEPLTNITNTKLLCCNNASVTGSTVTPGTIDATGDPTASSDSPFDDLDGFKFGENEDQNIIKCGRYIGNGSTNGPEIDLGWEPQWLLIKRVNGAEQWFMFDCIRGIVTLGNYDKRIEIQSGPEDEDTWIDLNPRGFRPKTTNWGVNGSNDEYVYVAIRREDPLVIEAAESASDVFAIDTGSSTDVIPVFDSGFAVDFGIIKKYQATDNWWCSARLMQNRFIEPNRNVAGGTWDRMEFDSNLGWFRHPSYGTETISYMWKRHAGFDVVTWKGDATAGRKILHNLSKTPEMIWVKCRDALEDWQVYHKGFNGGTNPWEYSVRLNQDYAQQDTSNRWNDTAPTSIDFTVGGPGEVNGNSANYIGMLFASVDSISKCGYYSGDGSANLTITTGFQPRFLLIKRADGGGSWHLFDSVRGMGGTDKLLQLNSNAAQLDVNYVTVSSTGWTTEGTSLTNGNYIYYAHA